MSPMDAMSALVAGNPPTDAASVGDLITSINAAFASDPTANPAHRFEGTFFSGTPALDASGNPSARVNTQIDPSVSLDYGVQANDKSIRDVLKGLYMFAAVDVADISPDAYEAYVGESFSTLGSGLVALRGDGPRRSGPQTAADPATST